MSYHSRVLSGWSSPLLVGSFLAHHQYKEQNANSVPSRNALLGLKSKRRRVDTVAQPARRGSIRENVSQVPITAGAENLRAAHPMTHITNVPGPLLRRGTTKARPATAAIKLGLRGEQLGITADTIVGAWDLRVPKGAGKRALCAALASDVKLLGIQ
jgi:hypothetical protein